jgi:diguanylate cyclase (GGDEF)-like protein/PAS domain S-box-containing protein
MAFKPPLRAVLGRFARAATRAREDSKVDRRERRTEAAVAAAFVACAGTLTLVTAPHAFDVPVAAWLTGLAFVLLQIEFEVGQGRTRPVQLALVPMLIVLPPALVPGLLAFANVLARLPQGGRSFTRLVSSPIADVWFALGPAVVLTVAGSPSGFWAWTVVAVLALSAQIGLDFAVASVRLRAGLGLSMEGLLSGFGWVYLVDVLLTPVGILAAVVGAESPWSVAAVLPLAALLSIFARERAGRIENARALHRMAEENEARLESIVQNSSDLIAIVQGDGVIRTLTGATETVFGADRQAAVGRPLQDWAHPDDAPLVSALLTRVALSDAQTQHDEEWRILRADGSYGYVETVAMNLLHDERLRGIVLTARDVEDRRAFEEQLRHRAFHDPLTQLANRALFYDRIEHALARELRDEQRVAVLFIDLDDFKAINDDMGHGVGDELLVAVAGRLRGSLRSADTVARLGGDEFGVLIEGVAGSNEVVQTAERILGRFSEPFIVHGEAIAVRLSIGIAVTAEPDVDSGVDEMLRKADLAMYAAKRGGKGRWDLYDRDFERLALPASDSEPERLTWFQRGAEQREEVVNLLRRDDAIRMVFQPILDLRTGSVAGYEALARFVTPETRPPNAWFAQAHRFGLGYELEARALAAALAVPGRLPGTYLTVNVSPSALASAPVQAVLPESLEDIVVELTENELLSEAPGLEAALADVRARGGRVAIDDAGAGYAGLKHVMRLEPDLIKLDRSLVAGVEHDVSRASLIASFVGYGRDSGAAICAEGIETIGDLVRLADLDVALGQGYVIARPEEPWVPAAAAAVDACLVSFTTALSLPSGEGLEHVVAVLAGARDGDDLAAAEEPIARELRADEIVLDAYGTDDEVVQVLLGDATAEPADLERLAASGHGSLLRVPVTCEGVVVGALEAYRRAERPWSRFEIRCARMIAYQLGAAMARVTPAR